MKIRSITIVTYIETNSYSVGHTSVNGEVVDEIIDESAEWDNGIDFIYRIKSKGKTIAEIINCPVNIEYYAK